MDTLLPLFIGGIITALTHYSKKLGINARVTLAFSVIVSAVIYTAFQNFLDPATQEKVIVFATSTLGSAVLFYEYGIRFLKEDSTNTTPAPTVVKGE